MTEIEEIVETFCRNQRRHPEETGTAIVDLLNLNPSMRAVHFILCINQLIEDKNLEFPALKD